MTTPRTDGRAEPARTTGLAEIGVHVIGVGHRTDRCKALAVNEALLARLQTHNGIGA
jgi:hypothetical protein